MPLKYKFSNPLAVCSDVCLPISHTFQSITLPVQRRKKCSPSTLVSSGSGGFPGTSKDQCFYQGPWAPPHCLGGSGRTRSNSSGFRLATCLQSCSTGRGACACTLLTTSSSWGLPLLCISEESRQSSWSWGVQVSFNEIHNVIYWPLCLLQIVASSPYFLLSLWRQITEVKSKGGLHCLLAHCSYFMALCLPSSIPVIYSLFVSLSKTQAHVLFGAMQVDCCFCACHCGWKVNISFPVSLLSD